IRNSPLDLILVGREKRGAINIPEELEYTATGRNQLQLYELLRLVKERKSALEEDKIYRILGLADTKLAKKIKPVYKIGYSKALAAAVRNVDIFTDEGTILVGLLHPSVGSLEGMR